MTATIHDFTVQGYALENEGEADKARRVWTQALDAYPRHTVFALRKAVLSLNAHEVETALASLDQAAVSQDAAEYLEQIADLRRQSLAFKASRHNENAMTAYGEGRFETARDEFQALLEIEPTHPYARAYLVHCAAFSLDFEYQLRTRLPRVEQRILIAGCGRSGTWLLAAIMAGLDRVTMTDHECHYGQFAFMEDTVGTHIVKRQHDTYTVYERIPESIKIINIVRHPFDVMSSTHLGVEQYVPLDRYEAELSACLDVLIDRPNTLNIRFEDLVSNPDRIQAEIVDFTGLSVKVPFSQFHEHADMPTDIVDAMHGLRALDSSRLYAWRNKKDQFDRYRKLLNDSDGTCKRVGKTFSYSLDI